MNIKRIISILLFLMLTISCYKSKETVQAEENNSEINNYEKERQRNSIEFEFRGFKWNTRKDEIIKSEGIPKEKLDGYKFSGDIINTRETTITYYNIHIINNIYANQLEYTFIDDKLMKAEYKINLANRDELYRNYDDIKDNDYFDLTKAEIFKLFYELRAKLNELYVLLNDLNANYANEYNKRTNEYLQPLPSGAPIETTYGAKQTEINISLWNLSQKDTFWVSIDYEYSYYSALKGQIYDEVQLEIPKQRNGL